MNTLSNNETIIEYTNRLYVNVQCRSRKWLYTTWPLFRYQKKITIDKHQLGYLTMTFLDKMRDFIQLLGLSEGIQAGEKETFKDYVEDYFQEKLKERKKEYPILNFMLHPSNGRLLRS